MSFWILILLAIVQGLTEFLPVSSSGHLVLLYNFFGIENNVKLLSILLHLSTLLSVVVYYRKEIVLLIRHPLCPTNRKIVVTTAFTCLVVIFLKPFIDKSFNGQWLFVFFIVTAILLFISDYLSERHSLMSRLDNVPSSKFTSSQDILNLPINYKQAIIIGLTQGIACIPGISRRGSTIAVARMCGAHDTARYSFLISIPIIVASFILELAESGGIASDTNIISLIFAMIICFVVGLLCIKIMTKLVETKRLTIFSYYLIILSAILVILSFAK